MKKTCLTAAFALASTLVLGSVSGSPPRADTVPRSGDRMPDGTIYADISPVGLRPMYTTPADAPGVYTWDKAVEYCSALQAFGHHDWYVPAQGELAVEFYNRVNIGGFNLDGNRYWSSTQAEDNGKHRMYWTKDFSNGLENDFESDSRMSLRCVR